MCHFLKITLIKDIEQHFSLFLMLHFAFFTNLSEVILSFITFNSIFQQTHIYSKESMGLGRRDTQTIVNYCDSRGEINRAAQGCANMKLNDYKDWFLPSIHELYEMSKEKELFGFSTQSYWSSSQCKDEYDKAWTYYFYWNDDASSSMRDNSSTEARAIRAF